MLKERVVIVVGGGQAAGESIGNGRAAALRFAREGAKVVIVDVNTEAAEGTRELIIGEGFSADVMTANVLVEADCERIITATQALHQRIDVLHYNVGISEGDSELSTLPAETWDLLMNINLRGFYFCVKHVLPVMREQESGVITAVSSAAALATSTGMTYKASKAAMNALVQTLAVNNGPYGVRVNAILPGLMVTPMAIERRARERGVSREIVSEERDKMVPLRNKQGTAWDVANCAVFLASDEASYISGVSLPVDGAITARVG